MPHFRKDHDHPHFGDVAVMVLSDAQFGELKSLLEQIRDGILGHVALSEPPPPPNLDPAPAVEKLPEAAAIGHDPASVGSGPIV